MHGALAWIVGGGSLVVAVSAFVGAGIALWRFISKMMHFRDDVLGEDARPGREAQPGLLERMSRTEGKVDGLDRGQVHLIEQLATLKDVVAQVKATLEPNHGSSLYDMVKRLDDRDKEGAK